MRRRRCLQGARSRSGRWLATLLVAVIAIDAPVRAFAQAAATGTAPAGASSPTAPSTPREGALAPPASGKPPASGGAGTSGTGVVSAPSIPEGPGFATGQTQTPPSQSPTTPRAREAIEKEISDISRQIEQTLRDLEEAGLPTNETDLKARRDQMIKDGLRTPEEYATFNRIQAGLAALTLLRARRAQLILEIDLKAQSDARAKIDLLKRWLKAHPELIRILEGMVETSEKVLREQFGDKFNPPQDLEGKRQYLRELLDSKDKIKDASGADFIDKEKLELLERWRSGLEALNGERVIADEKAEALRHLENEPVLKNAKPDPSPTPEPSETRSIDAPVRAVAQAASGQPAAAAQSGTASKLANVPDSIPYEANPYPDVPQTRTMSTAIKEALENAGIDTKQGSPRYDETPTADTVRFEGDYPDGDLIVTGQLVNGRIVLTKQFKPLLPSGDGVGAAVTIPFNPTTTTAVAAASPAPGSGTALDLETTALNSAIEGELKGAYDDVVKQAKALQGERIVSGINIADGTLVFAILTRNLYAFQLSVHIARLEHYANQPRADRIAHIQRLQALAKRIQYWWAIRAYLINALSSGHSIRQIQGELRDRAQEAGADPEKARALLNMADHPEAWVDLASAEIFKLVDQDPIVAASEPFLRRLWAGDRPEELLEMYDDVVADTAVDAQAELARVRALNTVEGITEFLQPQYARTRATAAMTLGRFSQNQHALVEAYARSLQEVQGLERDPLGLNTPLIIGGLIILSLVVPANMPILLALVGAVDVAAAGYALYHDVPYLLDLGAAAANAQRGRIVLGPDAFSKLSDEQQIVALGILLSAFGVATGGRALTKAVAEARAAEILRRAKANAAAARAAAGAPAGARARGLSPEEGEYWVNRTPENAMVVVDGRTVPARQQVRDNLQEVDELVRRAGTAGVSDKQIAGVLQRARSRSALDDGFVERIDEELRIEEANSRGATILVDRSDYSFDPVTKRFKGQFAEYIGGAQPNSVRAVNLQDYSEIRTKMALEATGRPQRWTPEQARIIREEILPQGDAVKNWYGFEGQTADRGLSPMRYDDEFMATARDVFGPTPKRTPHIEAEAPPRPRGSQRAGDATPVRGGDTAGDNLRRPVPKQGAPNRGAGQPPPGVTTTDPGQTRIDPGQTRIDPGQTIVDPKLPTLKAPGGPGRGTGAAMGAVGAAGAGAASGSGAAAPGSTEVGLNIPFADRIPDGPGLAISGAEKPTKLDAPSTATAIPAVIRMDGDNSYALNPAIINDAGVLLVVQYLAAEGTEVTVPSSTEPSKDHVAARTLRPPSPRSILEGLASFLLKPIRANLGNGDERRRSERWRGVNESRAVTPLQTAKSAAMPAAAPPVKIILTSTGRSSGDAFQMTVLNEGPVPVRLTGDSFVLEPVADVTQATVDRELAQTPKAGRATTTLKAYCLEFLKQRPALGMLFRLAPEGVQRRFASAAPIFRASRKLRDEGKLRPGPGDPSDPASYVDDIRQWAIWTQEQKFDEKSYARAFTEHARKNVESAGHKWTRELENAFAGLASGRWQAVQMVLRDAAAAR